MPNFHYWVNYKTLPAMTQICYCSSFFFFLVNSCQSIGLVRIGHTAQFWIEFALLSFALSGTKSRLGTESGYSSLEKTSPHVADEQAHTDSRCDCDSVCSAASHPCMFPTLKSLSSCPFPPPTNHSPQGKPKDVVGCFWEKSLESNEDSKSHTSMTHTLRHEAPSPRRKVHRLFGNRQR